MTLLENANSTYSTTMNSDFLKDDLFPYFFFYVTNVNTISLSINHLFKNINKGVNQWSKTENYFSRHLFSMYKIP